jgi:hypothetical protein
MAGIDIAVLQPRALTAIFRPGPIKAFSSEVAAGSRKENASKQKRRNLKCPMP